MNLAFVNQTWEVRKCLWSVSLRMGPIVYRVRSMNGAGCTVGSVLSVNSQHAGTQQPCQQPCQEPRSSSPSHHCESPWANSSQSPRLFQPLPKSEVGVNLKASLRWCSASRLTRGFNNIKYRVTSLPWAPVSPSWSWAARGGAASCPGSTSRVCPATAAPRCPPHR